MTTTITVQTAGHGVKIEKLQREGRDSVVETIYLPKETTSVLYIHSGLSLGCIEETAEAQTPVEAVPAPEPAPAS